MTCIGFYSISSHGKGNVISRNEKITCNHVKHRIKENVALREDFWRSHIYTHIVLHYMPRPNVKWASNITPVLFWGTLFCLVLYNDKCYEVFYSRHMYFVHNGRKITKVILELYWYEYCTHLIRNEVLIRKLSLSCYWKWVVWICSIAHPCIDVGQVSDSSSKARFQ